LDELKNKVIEEYQNSMNSMNLKQKNAFNNLKYKLFKDTFLLIGKKNKNLHK